MVQKKLPVILYNLNKVRGWVYSSPTDGAQGTLPDIRNKRLPSVLADFGSNTSTLFLPLGTNILLEICPLNLFSTYRPTEKETKIEYAFAFETYYHGIISSTNFNA